MSSRTAEAPLRLLHLEDSELDHALTLLHLQRGGLRVESQRVDSEADFLLALEQPWDVIVSDYNLPGFSGLVALDLLMARGDDVPFVLVSGEIGEDTAVEAMRNGASDYLLKNNLARLVPASRSSACRNWRSTCKPASRWSAQRSPVRSMTMLAAR